jgi:hypothetical protein
LWAAVVASVLGLAGAFVLWPSEPESGGAGTWPAAGSLSPAPSDPPPVVTRDVVTRDPADGSGSSPPSVDSADHRAALGPSADVPITNDVRREPLPEVAGEPAPDVARQPDSEAPGELSIDVENLDADALEAVLPPRVKRLRATSSSKGRVARQSSRRSSSKTRKKALASDSAELPSSVSPARAEDPFAERR